MLHVNDIKTTRKCIEDYYKIENQEMIGGCKEYRCGGKVKIGKL